MNLERSAYWILAFTGLAWVVMAWMETDFGTPEAVLGWVTVGGFALGNRHHAGVVDEQIDSRMSLDNSFRRIRNRCKRGQIERDNFKGGVGQLSAQSLLCSPGLVRVACGYDNVSPGTGECARRFETESAVCPGDDGDSARLIRDVSMSPRHDIVPFARVVPVAGCLAVVDAPKKQPRAIRLE